MRQKLKDIIKEEGINITQEALDVLLNIERDFRQLLNILQGIHTYYSLSEQIIDKQQVYQYTGKPTQEDVDKAILSLFNEDFQKANQTITDMIVSGNIDLAGLACDLASKLPDLSPSKTYFILQVLSDIEKKAHLGCNTRILVSLLTSAFLKLRNEIGTES